MFEVQTSKYSNYIRSSKRTLLRAVISLGPPLTSTLSSAPFISRANYTTCGGGRNAARAETTPAPRTADT